MNVTFTYEELDELLHFAKLEADFAAASIRGAAEEADRDLARDRFANARYLMQRLEDALAKAGRGAARDGYLLQGAKPWAERYAGNFRAAPVLKLVHGG